MSVAKLMEMRQVGVVPPGITQGSIQLQRGPKWAIGAFQEAQ